MSSDIPAILRVLEPVATTGTFPLPVTEEPAVFPILDSTVTLGRGLHNAIVLFDPTVSREHVTLTRQPGGWLATNHSTTSPLLVGERPVPAGGAALLMPGQILQLGVVRVQLVAPNLSPSVQALAESGTRSGVGSTVLRSTLALRRAVWPALRGWGAVVLLAVILAFVVTLGLVIVGVGALITQRAATGGFGWLVIPLIPAAGVVLLVTLIDRYERKPWYLLLCSFLWGAVIAIPPALFIEMRVSDAINALALAPGVWGDVSHSALLGLNAGVTEEIVKGAGLVALLLIVRDKFTTISDGIMYGALIGAGFAMIENVAYFANADSRHALAFLIIGRVALGWLGHSTFTGIIGAALGYARERAPRPGRWRVPALGFSLAVLLHSFFDFVGFQATTAQDAGGAPLVGALAQAAIVLDYVPLFVAQFVLLTILMRSLARETAILRQYLVDDVLNGDVTPDEYLLLQIASPRTRLERALLLLRGARLWRVAKQLQAAIISLGFARWQAATGAPSETPSVALTRARIRQLRRALAALEAPEPLTPRHEFERSRP